MAWGSDTNNESKPDWTWLTTPGRGNSAPKSANVFATERGWELKWPWGNEVLVGLGGLNTNLGNSTVVGLLGLQFGGSEHANIAAQTLSVAVEFNEAVLVTGTPTVVAISNNASPANATLTYVSADSDLPAGRLVFRNSNVAVNVAVTATGKTYTVNSTSTVAGWDGIVDAVTSNAVSNGVPNGVSAIIATVVSELPFQGVNLAGANLANAAAQTIQFTLGFNRTVAVANANSTSPSVVAISNSATHANSTLVYVPSASNATHLVFRSPVLDLSALTANITFAVNSTSTLVGFANIADVNGNVAANTISTANTQTVVAA